MKKYTIMEYQCGMMTIRKGRSSKMKCFLCKGNMEPDTTSYMTEIDNRYIIIKNVPCTKCAECGEEFITGVILQNIEKIIAKLNSALAEIAVVEYSDAA
jgi:YgiT-type zinc finger domain-containing protein